MLIQLPFVSVGYSPTDILDASQAQLVVLDRPNGGMIDIHKVCAVTCGYDINHKMLTLRTLDVDSGKILRDLYTAECRNMNVHAFRSRVDNTLHFYVKVGAYEL